MRHATSYTELQELAADRADSDGCRGRYAPSPTGPLHLGNARTALVAWLQARLAGGVFIMRLEDLDQPRVKPGSAAQLLDDLDWLGLDWDEGDDVGGAFGPYAQSQRDHLYEHALEVLRARGRLFPCMCSRKDVQRAASAPHGATPVYPGTCRDLAPDRIAARRDESGRRPAWRYRADGQTITFDDCVYGRFVQDLAREVGDFVIRRSDRLFAYQLAVAVDDALMGVTDVVRGADLLDSTARQIALLRALELPAPRYWHLPLYKDEYGRRMSKRGAAYSIAEFRDAGGGPAALTGQLAASLGLAPPGPISCRELLAAHSLESMSTALIAAARRDGSDETGCVDGREVPVTDGLVRRG